MRKLTFADCPHSRPRHGVSIIYVSVSMLVLLGFCSLAVDLGRVQAVKTQLEVATDAAARAGVANLPMSPSQSLAAEEALVQGAAYKMAYQNTADGSPVIINSVSNVSFLNWPKTAPLSGQSIATANAVQVNTSLTVPLLFAQALGMPSATVHATSTAYEQTTTNYGLVGTTSVYIEGQTACLVDSYNSNLGPYGGGNVGSEGSLAGGGISVAGGSVVNGNLYYSSTSTPSTSNGTVHGTMTRISPLSYPTPTLPVTYTNLGAVTISNGQTLTLNTGNYYCTSFMFVSTGTLNINATSGPVNLYVGGAFTMDYYEPGGTLNWTSTIPNNFHIYATTSAAIGFNGLSVVYGVVDAPLSTVNCIGGGFYGSIISKTLTTSYGNGLHYDQALGYNGQSQTIAQVQ